MKRRVHLGFFALCLWAGSAWLYDLFLPGALTGLLRIAIHDALVIVACLAWAKWRGEPGLSPRLWCRLAIFGALLFGVPEVLLAGASVHVTQSTGVLVFMLVPIVVVFWIGQQAVEFGAGENALRGLVPALAGLGGSALILPFQLPSSLVGRLWLAALVASAVAAGIAAISIHRLLAGVPLARAGAAILGTSFLLTAVFASVHQTSLPPLNATTITFEVLRLFVIDGPILILALWLLREMRPAAFSSRMLLIPAVTLVEGIIAERPEVGWYGWLGLSLTIMGGMWLLTTAPD